DGERVRRIALHVRPCCAPVEHVVGGVVDEERAALGAQLGEDAGCRRVDRECAGPVGFRTVHVGPCRCVHDGGGRSARDELAQSREVTEVGVATRGGDQRAERRECRAQLMANLAVGAQQQKGRSRGHDQPSGTKIMRRYSTTSPARRRSTYTPRGTVSPFASVPSQKVLMPSQSDVYAVGAPRPNCPGPSMTVPHAGAAGISLLTSLPRWSCTVSSTGTRSARSNQML